MASHSETAEIGGAERTGAVAPDAQAELRQAYLDLVRAMLTRTGFEGRYGVLHLDKSRKWWVRAAAPIQHQLRRRGLDVVRNNPERLRTGLDHPTEAETMIGSARLDNLQECTERVLLDGVPGDLIETGVWKGGACILMRAVLKAYGVRDRAVWAADSFQGLPKPSDAYPADAGDRHWQFDDLAISLADVKANFARYGLLDDQVRFLEGWFSETLPTAPIAGLALLRLDGDMYGSTYEALDALYPKLSPGGYVIVDDYHLEGCRAAVSDYRDRNGLEEPIVDIDGRGAFWRREF